MILHPISVTVNMIQPIASVVIETNDSLLGIGMAGSEVEIKDYYFVANLNKLCKKIA